MPTTVGLVLQYPCCFCSSVELSPARGKTAGGASWHMLFQISLRNFKENQNRGARVFAHALMLSSGAHCCRVPWVMTRYQHPLHSGRPCGARSGVGIIERCRRHSLSTTQGRARPSIMELASCIQATDTRCWMADELLYPKVRPSSTLCC